MNNLKNRFQLTDSLSYLDEETVAALFADEELLALRRRTALARRLGAAAACIAIAGGAGLALYTDTKGGVPAAEKTLRTNPADTDNTAPTQSAEDTKTVFARPGEPSEKLTDAYCMPDLYMPYHSCPGDVSVMRALKNALEKEPDPETLFRVAISVDCKGLDSREDWRKEPAWTEYQAASAEHRSEAEKEYEAVLRLWRAHSNETDLKHCAYGFYPMWSGISEYSANTVPIAFARGDCEECQRILEEERDPARRNELLKEHWESAHNDCAVDLEIFRRLTELGRKNDEFYTAHNVYDAENEACASFYAKLRADAEEYLALYGIEIEDFRDLYVALYTENSDGEPGLSVFSSQNAAMTTLTREQIERLASKEFCTDGLNFGLSIELMPEEKDLSVVARATIGRDSDYLTDVSPENDRIWDEVQRTLLIF